MKADTPNRPHYVYRCFDSQDRLLYIGCTVDLAARFTNHRRFPASQRWLPLMVRRDVETFPNRSSAREAEREAILLERPAYNEQHNHGATCLVDGCDEEWAVLDYCARHYWRLKQYGDPLGRPAWETMPGSSTNELCDLVGITYRQADYWCRQGLLESSVSVAEGSGTRRRFSTDDVLRAQNLKTAAEIIAAVYDGTIWERVLRGDIVILAGGEDTQTEAAA